MNMNRISIIRVSNTNIYLTRRYTLKIKCSYFIERNHLRHAFFRKTIFVKVILFEECLFLIKIDSENLFSKIQKLTFIYQVDVRW